MPAINQLLDKCVLSEGITDKLATLLSTGLGAH